MPSFSSFFWGSVKPRGAGTLDHLTAGSLCLGLLLQWQGVSNPGNTQSQLKASDWPLQWWMVKGSQKTVPLVMVSWVFSLFHTFFNPNAQRDLVYAVMMMRPPETETGGKKYIYGFKIRLVFPFPSQLPHLHFKKLGGIMWVSKENCYLLLFFSSSESSLYFISFLSFVFIALQGSSKYLRSKFYRRIIYPAMCFM